MSKLPEDLSRFLFLVPYVAQHRDGVEVRELCERMSMTPAELRGLIERVAMVGAPDGAPDEMVEIYLEGDRVFVALPQRFTRPPRFSVQEMVALLLSLAPLRESGLPALRQEADALTTRLVELASERATDVAPAIRSRVLVQLDGRERPEHLRDLETAVNERRVIRAEYYTAGRDDLTTRELRPVSLMQIRGAWYVVDHIPKTFKVERFRSIELTDERFEVSVPDLQSVRRRIIGGMQPEQEPVLVSVGGRTRTFRGAERGVRRWVRGRKGEAVIVGPAAARQAMVEETEALLELYK